jgi:hypothetical protein
MVLTLQAGSFLGCFFCNFEKKKFFLLMFYLHIFCDKEKKQQKLKRENAM